MRPLLTRPVALVLCVTLLITFALLSFAAEITKSPTMDEPLHTMAAYTHTFMNDFRLNPEDPPLWKYWAMLPHLRSELKPDIADPAWTAVLTDTERQMAVSVRELFWADRVDGARFIERSRLMMLVPAIAIGVLVIAWAWRLGGSLAAVVAAALFCLDPNFLAHAPLVKNDIAITLLLTWMMFALYLLGQRISIPALIAAIAACAIAPSVKFSGIIFWPLLTLTLAIRALLSDRWTFIGRRLATRKSRLAAAAVISLTAAFVSWITLWAAYDFRFHPTPDGNVLLNTQSQIDIAAAELHGRDVQISPAPTNRFPTPIFGRLILLAQRLRLAPQAWLYGLLYTWCHSLQRSAFLLGMRSNTGWWYYFPLAMLFKTPLATLIATFLATAGFVRLLTKRRLPLLAGHRWALICLALPVVVYGLSALNTNLNIGLRHVLPFYPFVYTATATIAARFAAQRSKTTIITISLLAVTLLLETAFAYPNFIPFFNFPSALAGRLNLLSDSNLDWGQDLPLLAQWRQEHPDQKLYLCYFGSADPAFYHIDYTNLPSGYFMSPQSGWPATPGVIAVSATKLQGVNVYPQFQNFYAQLRKLKPREILGGSIYLYEWPAHPK